MAGLLLAPITFVMSLDRTAIVIAAPTIQSEYHFTLVQMSFLLTSFSWTYALFQVPSGWLAERFGPRKMLYWANLLWSFGSGEPTLQGDNGAWPVGGLAGAEQAADHDKGGEARSRRRQGSQQGGEREMALAHQVGGQPGRVEALDHDQEKIL
jgi:ACS family glucarate transporter-like MFS transporter